MSTFYSQVAGKYLSAVTSDDITNLLALSSTSLSLYDKARLFNVTLVAPDVLANDCVITVPGSLPGQEYPLTIDANGIMKYNSFLNINGLVASSITAIDSVFCDRLTSTSGNLSIQSFASFTSGADVYNGITTDSITSHNGQLAINTNTSVAGDFTVNGSLTSINTTDIEIVDSLIRLASNNNSDAMDIGMFGTYVSNDKTYAAGLARLSSTKNKEFFLFSDIDYSDISSSVITDGAGIGIGEGDVGLLSKNSAGFIVGNTTITDNHKLIIAPASKSEKIRLFNSSVGGLDYVGIDVDDISITGWDNASTTTPAHAITTSLIYNVRKGDAHVFTTNSSIDGKRSILTHIDDTTLTLYRGLELPIPESTIASDVNIRNRQVSFIDTTKDLSNTVTFDQKINIHRDVFVNATAPSSSASPAGDVNLVAGIRPYIEWTSPAVDGASSPTILRASFIDINSGRPFWDIAVDDATKDSFGDYLKHPVTGLQYIDRSTGLLIINPYTGAPFVSGDGAVYGINADTSAAEWSIPMYIEPRDANGAVFIDPASGLPALNEAGLPTIDSITGEPLVYYNTEIPLVNANGGIVFNPATGALFNDAMTGFLDPKLIVIGISPIDPATDKPYIDVVTNLPITNSIGDAIIDATTGAPIYDTTANSFVIDAKSGLLVVNLKTRRPFIDYDTGIANLSGYLFNNSIQPFLNIELETPLHFNSKNNNAVVFTAPVDVHSALTTASAVVQDTLIAGTTLVDSIHVTNEAVFDDNVVINATGKLIAPSAELGGLVVNGDVTVSGKTTFINTETLNIKDPVIALAEGNYSDNVNTGFISNYIDGSGETKQTGLIRSSVDKAYYLVQDAKVDLSAGDVAVDVLPRSDLYANDVVLNNIRARSITATNIQTQGIQSSLTLRPYYFKGMTFDYALDGGSYSIVLAKGECDQSIILPDAAEYDGRVLTIIKTSDAAYCLSIEIVETAPSTCTFDGVDATRLQFNQKNTKIQLIAVDGVWFTL